MMMVMNLMLMIVTGILIDAILDFVQSTTV